MNSHYYKKVNIPHGSITASAAGDLFWVYAEVRTLAVCNVHLLSRCRLSPQEPPLSHLMETWKRLMSPASQCKEGKGGGVSSDHIHSPQNQVSAYTEVISHHPPQAFSPFTVGLRPWLTDGRMELEPT